jgi:hypothetical protein
MTTSRCFRKASDRTRDAADYVSVSSKVWGVTMPTDRARCFCGDRRGRAYRARPVIGHIVARSAVAVPPMLTRMCLRASSTLTIRSLMLVPDGSPLRVHVHRNCWPARRRPRGASGGCRLIAGFASVSHIQRGLTPCCIQERLRVAEPTSIRPPQTWRASGIGHSFWSGRLQIVGSVGSLDIRRPRSLKHTMRYHALL